jgi:hypothetical protein
MKRFRSWSKRKKTAVVALVVLVFASAAFAAWFVTTLGGSGKAKGSTLVAPSVVSPTDGAVVGNLFPSATGTAGSIYVLINNPNSVPLVVDAFGIPAGHPAASSDTAACPASNLRFATNGIDGDGDGTATIPLGTNGTNAVPSTIPANSGPTLVELKNSIGLVAAAPTD